MTPDRTIGRFKRVSEEFRIGWNFVDDLATGDTIASKDVSAQKVSDGSAASSFITGDAISNPEISVKVTGGTAGEDYDVVIKATTAQGEKFTRVIRVQVRD